MQGKPLLHNLQSKKVMEYDFYVYQCALSKIFANRFDAGRRLLERFSSVYEIFSMGEAALRELMPGGEQYINEILNPANLEWAQAEVDWAASCGIELLTLGSTLYPQRLKDCPDAPLVLYSRGGADLNAQHVVGVVGTRRSSYGGRENCRKIIAKLAENPIKPLIVSGLALGIDGVAHISSLDMGLQTVAVMPTGLDEIYPSRHRELADRILAEGSSLVTDFPRATTPMTYTFARRNRIIAGLSDAVLLAESYVPGGGLITARLASSYNREVFAVPGRMSDPSYEGCNKLISENVAHIVHDTDTIEKEMGWKPSRRRKRGQVLFHDDDTPAKKAVLEMLRQRAPQTLEEIVREVGCSMRELAPELLELEMDGRICKDRHFYYLCM